MALPTVTRTAPTAETEWFAPLAQPRAAAPAARPFGEVAARALRMAGARGEQLTLGAQAAEVPWALPKPEARASKA